MSIPALQAAVAALVVSVVNAFVALQVVGESDGTRIETAVVGVVSAAFLVANAIHSKP